MFWKKTKDDSRITNKSFNPWRTMENLSITEECRRKQAYVNISFVEGILFTNEWSLVRYCNLKLPFKM